MQVKKVSKEVQRHLIGLMRKRGLGYSRAFREAYENGEFIVTTEGVARFIRETRADGKAVM